MNSINLLPKSVIHQKRSSAQNRAGFLLSVSIIAISIMIYSGLLIKDKFVSDKIVFVNNDLVSYESMIDREIESKKIALRENKFKEMEVVLGDHTYYSKAFEVILDLINNDVYLASGSFSSVGGNSLVFSFSATAKNYDSAMRQIALFKDVFLIDEVSASTKPEASRTSSPAFERATSLSAYFILSHSPAV